MYGKVEVNLKQIVKQIGLRVPMNRGSNVRQDKDYCKYLVTIN